MSSGQTGQGKGKAKIGRRNVSRSERSGLQFPVGRIHRHLKRHSRLSVGAPSAVYCAAILEYITAEVVELAGNASKDLHVKRITPRHLQLAIRGDEELDKLVKATIAGGGVIPHVHRALMTKKEVVGGSSGATQPKITTPLSLPAVGGGVAASASVKSGVLRPIQNDLSANAKPKPAANPTMKRD